MKPLVNWTKPSKQATLCFLLRENEILLGMKKRGFGVGKYNGFGGKVAPGESVEEATVRELYEESGVKVNISDLEKVAEFDFFFPTVPKEQNWDQVVSVFFIRNWEGEPIESEEMLPVWMKQNSLPFEKMWEDDQHWFPRVLLGKKVRGKFSFDKDKLLEMFMDDNIEF